MTQSISLTVPMSYTALTRASDMLHGMALDIKKEMSIDKAPESGSGDLIAVVDGDRIYAETEITLAQYDQLLPEAQAAHTGRVVANPAHGPVNLAAPEAVFAAPKPDAAQVAAPEQTTVSTLAPATSAAESDRSSVISGAATHAPTAEAKGGISVELAPASTNPSVEIPWDVRIHASSKAKLAKKPNGWKMKRGVEESLIASVEAELIAAMGASPAAPVAPAAPEPAPVAVEPTPAPTAPTPPPAPAVAPTTAQPAEPMTFPLLMTRITAAKLDTATVTAAVNKQGLQGLPLLAARPDLIPGVFAELFPEG